MSGTEAAGHSRQAARVHGNIPPSLLQLCCPPLMRKVRLAKGVMVFWSQIRPCLVAVMLASLQNCPVLTDLRPRI